MAPPTLPADRIRGGMAELLEALEFTRAAKGDPWYFAVELSVLIAAGMSVNHIRWLMRYGHVMHGIERSRRRGGKASIRHVDWHRFDASSCFVLTPAGAELARSILQATSVSAAPAAEGGPAVADQADAGRHRTPRWLAEKRHLIFGGTIIVVLKRDAPNLEAILADFQKAAWVPTIPNPLAKLDEGDSMTSLHNAVNSLNSHQKVQRIHFSASKRGITWQPVAAKQQFRRSSGKRMLPTGRRAARRKSSARPKGKRRAKRYSN